MTLDIYVKPLANGFLATVFGLPDCTAEAPTEEEAIQRVQQKAQRWKKAAAVTSVEETKSVERKTRRFVGMWADNELFDEFVESMQQYRKELDANPETP